MRFTWLIILLFALRGNCLKVRKIEFDLISTFLKDNDVKYCFFLVCWTAKDKVKMSKILMQEKMNVRTAFLSTKKKKFSNAITKDYSKVTYILDLTCDEAYNVLEEGVETLKFTVTSSWLILASVGMSIDDVRSLFDPVDLRMDSVVKIAVPKNETRYEMYEIYDPGLEVDHKINYLGFFQNGRFSHLKKSSSYFQSRRNMTGVLVRGGNVNNFTAELLWEARNVVNYNANGGLFGLYLYYLYELFMDLLKFHQNTTISYPWFGYSSNGTDGGLGKLLYEDKIDVQIGGGIITVGRMPYFQPLTIPYFNLETFFYYRSPGIKKPGAQILQPLDPKVWYGILVTLVLTGVAIKIAYLIEMKVFHSDEIYNFFTTVMTVIGVLTQQGSAMFPQHLGGRIVFLNSLIFSILIYNYYTSGLVSSLLNSKPQMLVTYRDLYKSSLDVGMEDQAYTHLFVLHSKDRYLKQLYKKKIYGRHSNRGPNIFSAREGLEKVRRGGFAFHTMQHTAYPIISSTFDQEAICDLGYIAMLDYVGAMFLKRGSQYKELFVIGFTKMWENGISKQVYDNVVVKKPECRANLLVPAVGPQELFLVYLIFVAGVCLSIMIWLVELLYHRYYERKQIKILKIKEIRLGQRKFIKS